jgi:hypothetical protein
MITDQELIALNKRGLIPGPEETDQEFFARVHAENPSQPDLLTQEEWQETHALTQELFDFSADWVKAFYSKKSLPFWQGAATWLSTPPLIQLHPYFKKGTFFKIYNRKEVLAHEAVHAMRTPLQSSAFEEFFAYKTSSSSWRRWLGPIFRTSLEGTLFISLLAISMIASFFFAPLLFVPWLALSLGIFRLKNSHKLLLKCENKLKNLVSNPVFLLVRLTDQEIKRFFKSSPNEIKNFIHSEKEHSLRWKMLFLSYFHN